MKTELIAQIHQLFVNTDHTVTAVIEPSAFSITAEKKTQETEASHNHTYLTETTRSTWHNN